MINWEQEFANIGEKLPLNITQAVIDAANIVVEEIKAKAPVAPVDGGTLRDSIRARIVDSDFLGISMIEYGWYVNYGVRGVNSSRVTYGIPEPPASYLGVSEGYHYQYGTGNSSPNRGWGVYYTGLRGQLFLNVEEAIERVATIVNQNLEI
jgi:hypothetical protein